jgi:hypothetical protein
VTSGLIVTDISQIVPVALGRQHTSKASAHRSYAKVFHWLSVAALFVYLRVFYTTISANTPHEHRYLYERVASFFGHTEDKPATNILLAALVNTAHQLKRISKHPIISVTSTDVLFSAVSLLAWTFTRNLDVEALLDSSALFFLVPKHEKQVAFEADVKRLADLHSEPEPEPEPEPIMETTTPRKRGRPAKNKAVVNGAAAPPAGSVRRSTRKGARSADANSLHRDYDSEGDEEYQPSSKTQRAIAETEADGAPELDLVHGGESTALALFLTFAGGLGALASSALGAEVTGPRE